MFDSDVQLEVVFVIASEAAMRTLKRLLPSVYNVVTLELVDTKKIFVTNRANY